VLVKVESEENAFPAVKREARKRETAGHLLEAKSAVKPDGGRVASVCEEPRFPSAFSNPDETCFRQRRAYSATALLRGDEDAREVVAAGSGIGGSFRGRLKVANSTVACDATGDRGHHEVTARVFNVAEK
jgi:hypothetical protein